MTGGKVIIFFFKNKIKVFLWTFFSTKIKEKEMKVYNILKNFTNIKG